MTANDKPYTFDRVVRLLLGTAGIVAAILLLRYLADVIIPFAAAVVLAYLLNPVVTLFERKTGRRGAAVALTLTGLGVVSLAAVVLLIPLVAVQSQRFKYDFEALRHDVASSFESHVDASADHNEPPPDTATPTRDLPAHGLASSEEEKVPSTLGWSELKQGWATYRNDAGEVPRAKRLRTLRESVAGTYVGDLINQIATFARSDEFNALILEVARRAAISGWTVVTWGVNVLLGLTGVIIVLLYLVFLLLDYPDYARTWPLFLPPTYREPIVEFLEQFNIVMRRYFRGQSLVALLTGTSFAIGFTIIGLPMAVPFGLFVGLLNMVPYLQVVALIPGVFLAGLRAVEGDTSFMWSVALVVVVFAVVQIIQDGLITPRIMGKAVGLRPVAIMLGLFVWGKLLGFLGLLLAIPLTCLGIAYYQRFVLQRTADPDSASP